MNLTIINLNEKLSEQLSKMFISDREEYRKYFIPFSSFKMTDIKKLLKNSKKDRYWGILCGEKLEGMFMLRGFDEGYNRPSFGVYISEPFSNNGLSKLALQFALSWCEVNGIAKVMLKVHPDNVCAKRVYERAGFNFIERCHKSKQDIFEKSLK